MVLSHQTLSLPVCSQVIKVTTSEGLNEVVTLVVGVMGDDAYAIINAGASIARITKPLNAWLKTKEFSEAWLLDGYVSGQWETDREASFLEAFRLLHDLHKNGLLSKERVDECVEMISHYHSDMDLDGLITYLYLDDLQDIAESFIIKRPSQKEYQIWRAIWPKAVRLLKQMMD